MKKKILRKIFFILILIISIIVLIKLVNNLININSLHYSNIDIFNEEDRQKVKEKVNQQQESTILVVGNNEVSKSDIEIQEKRIQDLTDEQKKLTANSGDPIVETVKQNVEEQEAIKSGITIMQEQKDNYIQVAEDMYENSDKSISKKEYIEKWVKIQEKDEITDLYMAKTMKKIALNEFKCEDQEVNKAVEKFYNEKNTENLMNAYNEYILYLCKQYEIKY